MDSLLALSPWLVAMVALMACSGFFSASEAALFYLQPRDRRDMSHGSPGDKAAATLLEKPERLLSSILFWNLVINIAYFSLASIVAIRIEADPELGNSFAAVFAVLALLAIIFFSEMLPKSFGVLRPRILSSMVSLPCGGPCAWLTR